MNYPTNQFDLVIIMRDRAGGVPNVLANVLKFMRSSKIQYKIILVDQKEYEGSRIPKGLFPCSIERVQYDRYDSIHFLERPSGSEACC